VSASGDSPASAVPPEVASEIADELERLDDAPERVGKYRIAGMLGRGGMGVVYEGIDDDLGRDVAIKLVRFGAGSGERLIREARALARLTHPNVVTIHEVGRAHDGVYLAMELVRGRPLDAWAADTPDWRDRAAMLAQAARGLAAAHRCGLVHRDFKPANVLVGSDDRARVLDFGIALTGSEMDAGELPVAGADSLSRLTETGNVMGTPLFMAPEQWTGNETGARTDQFSFCVVAYEILFGQRPFRGDNLRELGAAVLDGAIEPAPPSEVPESLGRVILEGMAVDPGDRHESMEPLIAALEEASSPTERRWAWIVAAAVIAVALAALIVAANIRSQRALSDSLDPTGEIIDESRLPATEADPVDDDPMRLTTHRLDNGLTVYISPRRDDPEIRARLIFWAGDRDDPGGDRGLAQLVARLIPRGSTRIGTVDFEAERVHLDRLRTLSSALATADPAERAALWEDIEVTTRAAARFEILDEHQRTVAEIGGATSAPRVGFETAVFEARFPSSRLATWARLEAERWRAPAFRGFYAELAALAQRPLEQPNLEELLVAATSPRPPRAPFDPARLTVKDVEAFYSSWFAPNNAALILVGDVDAGRVDEIEEAFADWEPVLIDREPPALRPLGDGPVELPALEPAAAMVWSIPSASANQLAALSALARYLDSETGGVLAAAVPELENGGALVRRVGLSAVLAVGGRLRAGASAEGASRSIAALIDSIRGGELDGELFAATAAQEGLFELRRARDPEAIFERAGRAYRAGLGWSAVLAHRERAAAATADAALDTARALEGPVPVIAAPVETAVAGPPISAVTYADAAHSRWVVDLLAAEAVPPEPRFLFEGRHYRRLDHRAGPLIAAPNPGDSLFALTLRWEIGREAIGSICAVLDAALDLDPTSEASRRRRLEWLRLGLTATASCDARSVTIEVRGDDRHFDASLAALDRLLAGAGLESVDVGARAAARARRRAAAASSRERIAEAARHLALAGRGAPQLRLDDPRSLGRLNAAAARAALARLAATKRAQLYYGPREPGELARRLDVAAAPQVRAVRPSPVRITRPRSPRVVLVDDRRPGLATAHVIAPLAHPGDQAAAFELLDAYLGGPGNPIAAHLQSLNLDASLDASVEIPFDRRSDAALALRIEASPEHIARAAIEAVAVIRELEIDDDRLEAARSLLELRQRTAWVAPLEIPALVYRWTRAGFDRDPRIDRFRAAAGLDRGDLARAARAASRAPIIADVVGDVERIDLAALRRLGRIRTTRAARLLDRGALSSVPLDSSSR
jgi:serine/threonine protein kinase